MMMNQLLIYEKKYEEYVKGYEFSGNTPMSLEQWLKQYQEINRQNAAQS